VSESESTTVAVTGTDVVPADELPVDEIPGTFGLQAHPDPRQYVFVGIILVIVTAFEVAVSYSDSFLGPNFIILILAAAAVVKFVMVCAYFMHMKQDKPFFRRVFTVGIVGAFIVYGIVILMFSSTVLNRFFNSGP
jgi:cytochrome c oxidase subunit IV